MFDVTEKQNFQYKNSPDIASVKYSAYISCIVVIDCHKFFLTRSNRDLLVEIGEKSSIIKLSPHISFRSKS